MPISYCIDSEQGVVLSRASGTVTGAEVHAHERLLRGDPAFEPAFRQLVDLRDTTRIDISTTMMQRIAETRVFRRGHRCAFVASGHDQFGMARMFASFAALRGDEVEVFREWPTAVAWLGLSGDIACDGAAATTA
jgi:hypothetical protein